MIIPLKVVTNFTPDESSENGFYWDNAVQHVKLVVGGRIEYVMSERIFNSLGIPDNEIGAQSCGDRHVEYKGHISRQLFLDAIAAAASGARMRAKCKMCHGVGGGTYSAATTFEICPECNDTGDAK